MKARYRTVDELVAAYAAGELTEPLWVDNDTSYIYEGNRRVFDCHPGELLELLLTHAGIPWEHV